MSGQVTRFLGDTPWRVFVKLVVLSLLLGFVMTVFGWTPYDIYFAARDFVLDIWNTGFAAIERFAGYFLLGAAVVVPVFLVIRFVSFRR